MSAYGTPHRLPFYLRSSMQNRSMFPVKTMISGLMHTRDGDIPNAAQLDKIFAKLYKRTRSSRRRPFAAARAVSLGRSTGPGKSPSRPPTQSHMSGSIGRRVETRRGKYEMLFCTPKWNHKNWDSLNSTAGNNKTQMRNSRMGSSQGPRANTVMLNRTTYDPGKSPFHLRVNPHDTTATDPSANISVGENVRILRYPQQQPPTNGRATEQAMNTSGPHRRARQAGNTRKRRVISSFEVAGRTSVLSPSPLNKDKLGKHRVGELNISIDHFLS